MKFSKYQEDIFDFVKNGKGNAVINAVAGSGKTTTIVKALEFIPSYAKTIFLAFNKSIVKELETRVPKHVRVSTLHSFGFSALKFKFGKIEVNNYKVKDYLKIQSQFWSDVDEEDMYDYIARVAKLVDFARFNLAETVEEIDELSFKHGIPLSNGESKRALKAVQDLRRNVKTIDFADMIYLPAVLDMQMLKYDYIFVDECQDLNRAQQEMVKRILKTTGRFVAVGDPSQSIYGFAGADVESFNRLMSMPNTTSLPLSVSYRCGKKIIEKAQQVVPEIEHFEGSPDGEVRYNGHQDDIKDGDMVLCRNTAPLVEMCLSFLAEERKAYVKGGDIGVNLVNMIKKQKAHSLTHLGEKLNKELDKLVKTFGKKYDLAPDQAMATDAYQILQDKVNVIRLLARKSESIAELISKIETIFADDKAGIVFSTIHKSKGLEADTIHVIRPDLMPSKYAFKTWQKQQEANLEYVMITRAKSLLNYIPYTKGEEM